MDGKTLWILGAAVCVGLVMFKLRVPGGMLIGAVIGAAAVKLWEPSANFPYLFKMIAQITAGAFIGCTIDIDQIKGLRSRYKPILLALSGFFLLMFLCGFLLWRIGPLDLLTSLICSVPGGVSDTALVAAEFGAGVTPVILMQFTRMCVGMGFFPAWIDRLDRETSVGYQGTKRPRPKLFTGGKGKKVLPLLLSAAGLGIVGKLLKFPSGTLVFAMLGALIAKLTFCRDTVLPSWLKRLAQVFSGAYVGCCVTMESIALIPSLILPVAVLIGCYMAYAYGMGKLLSRRFRMPLREAMLMVTPAGASDIMLISSDIGVQSATVVLTHIIRVILALSVFPQICYFVANMVI